MSYDANKFIYETLILLFLSCCSAGPAAQRFGVKTNALNWATAGTLNAGLESAAWSKRTSLELTGDYNPWTLDRMRTETQILVGDAGVPLLAPANASTAIFSDCTPPWRIQYQRCAHPFLKKVGEGPPLSGWATGLGIPLPLLLAAGPALESGGDRRCGIRLYELRPLRMCDLRQIPRTGDRHYFGPTKAGISIIYIID